MQCFSDWQQAEISWSEPHASASAGNTPGIRIAGPSMYVAGMIGLLGGFCLAYQTSAGRLMGLLPNEKEAASVKR
jgi:hypothetical protein